MILLCLILTILFEGVNAVYCRRDYYTFTSYFYCSDYCCGDECCYYSYYWGGARIAGCVIGGIIGFIALISIILFIIKACTKSGTHGRVVQPGQHPPGVFVVNTGTTSTGYSTQPGLPPPYPGSGPAYPPASYPQPSGQANKPY